MHINITNIHDSILNMTIVIAKFIPALYFARECFENYATNQTDRTNQMLSLW